MHQLEGLMVIVSVTSINSNPILLQKRSGDEALKALEGSEGLQLSKLLDRDPEFDSSLPSSKDFLIAQKLQCLAG